MNYEKLIINDKPCVNLTMGVLEYYQNKYKEHWKHANWPGLKKTEEMLNLVYKYIMQNKEHFSGERL